jgi:hypothetical protein
MTQLGDNDMRNVWKGLVVGGLTGVTAGIVLDSAARASKKAAVVGEQVRERAPEAGQWLQSLTGRAGEWLHDAEVPEHVRDAASRITESEAMHRVKEAKDEVVSTAKGSTASR